MKEVIQSCVVVGCIFLVFFVGMVQGYKHGYRDAKRFLKNTKIGKTKGADDDVRGRE